MSFVVVVFVMVIIVVVIIVIVIVIVIVVTVVVIVLVVMTVSRLLVCWLPVKQRLVMIVGFCTKTTMMTIVVTTVTNNKQ